MYYIKAGIYTRHTGRFWEDYLNLNLKRNEVFSIRSMYRILAREREDKKLEAYEKS